MRVIVIFLVLLALGYIAWKAAERVREEGVEPPAETGEQPVSPGETPAQPPAPSLPSFDIVRVDRTGYAVIAGRAKPSADVEVTANGDALADTTAENDGSWVITTDTPLDAGPVELGVCMTEAGGQKLCSEETIVIYVPDRPGDRPLVLRTTPGGATEVLQDPRDPDASLGPLSLDAIDYDDSGAVIFSGRATPERRVQIFINGQFLAETTSGADGRWTIQPTTQIAPGIYTLHVYQLDQNGRPEYAIELPFERARPEDIDLRDGRVIVQPGNSLWRIARRAYGQGAQYTIIYEANRDQIRDPDLIYPGQVFDVPEDGEGNGDADEGEEE